MRPIVLKVSFIVIHFGLATRYRLLWLFPTICLCGIGEVIGWSGRLWSSYDPLNSTPFQIQITCTIIAPTPFLAANFIIFGRLIRTLGYKYSRLSPKWCMYITSTFNFSLQCRDLNCDIDRYHYLLYLRRRLSSYPSRRWWYSCWVGYKGVVESGRILILLILRLQ